MLALDAPLSKFRSLEDFLKFGQNICFLGLLYRDQEALTEVNVSGYHRVACLKKNIQIYDQCVSGHITSEFEHKAYRKSVFIGIGFKPISVSFGKVNTVGIFSQSATAVGSTPTYVFPIPELEVDPGFVLMIGNVPYTLIINLDQISN